jgi:hypothetical protein
MSKKHPPKPMPEYYRDEYCLSDNPSRLQLDVIHRFLAEQSSWAQGIERHLVERSVANSMCFGVYCLNDNNDTGDNDSKDDDEWQQIGFARLVTDRTTFAYLCDVFIVGEHRGRGLSAWLLERIVEHPELQGLRRWMLATSDAHGLYERVGFSPLDKPEIFMQIHTPNVYANVSENAKNERTFHTKSSARSTG